MTKNYFYIILLFLCFSATSALAQDGKQQSKVQENTIESLNVYPNPTTGDRIYITWGCWRISTTWMRKLSKERSLRLSARNSKKISWPKI